MKTLLIPFVIAVIHRDMAEQVPVEVMMHELPILEQVHGKPLEVAEGAKPTQPPREIDPIEEYERMIRKYGDHPKAGIPYVERVFGRPRDFAAALAEIATNPDASLAPADDEGDDAADGLNPLTAELDNLTKAQLQALASQLDIPGTSGMNKAQLIENIIEKRDLILEDQAGAGAQA